MPAKILYSKFVISSPSYEKCPPSEIPEYAFIGRSNVGKSSLINAICEKKEFAKTSPKPGKTQLINYFEIESSDEEKNKQTWHLVDLPGYGYSKVSKEASKAWEGMISEYMLKRKKLARVFVLIDSNISPQHSDLAFINRLNACHIPFSIVFTKVDKASQKEISANIKVFLSEIGTMMHKLPEQYMTSTEKKGSTQSLVDAIHQLNSSILRSQA